MADNRTSAPDAPQTALDLALDLVAAVITETQNIDPARVVPDAVLTEDLNFDDLSFIEVAIEIEDRARLILPDERLMECCTVGDLAALVEAVKQARIA